MYRTLKLAMIPALAIGMAVLAGGAKADAGGFSISIGNYGYHGYSAYSSLRPSYGAPAFYGRSCGPQYSYHRSHGHSSLYRGSYNVNRPRYDYRQPTFVPRGRHFDHGPGPRDYHYRGHGRR